MVYVYYYYCKDLDTNFEQFWTIFQIPKKVAFRRTARTEYVVVVDIITTPCMRCAFCPKILGTR